jgi:hypothetical protein
LGGPVQGLDGYQGFRIRWSADDGERGRAAREIRDVRAVIFAAMRGEPVGQPVDAPSGIFPLMRALM